MTISRVHFEFANRVKNVLVLNNPQEYLGPRYEEVLNFWMNLDELSEEQLIVVKERDEAFYNENYSEWSKARDLADDASEEVVHADYVYYAICAAWDDIYSAAGWATLELIGMHLILEQQPLTFLPMFLEVL